MCLLNVHDGRMMHRLRCVGIFVEISTSPAKEKIKMLQLITCQAGHLCLIRIRPKTRNIVERLLVSNHDLDREMREERIVYNV